MSVNGQEYSFNNLYEEVSRRISDYKKTHSYSRLVLSLPPGQLIKKNRLKEKKKLEEILSIARRARSMEDDNENNPICIDPFINEIQTLRDML